MQKVKLGVLLPTRGLLISDVPAGDISLLIRLARRAEAAGLDSVWVGDSLTAKPRLEPLATLGALATQTRSVRLGTAVLLAALRHPVLLAQTMATVDLISQGRLVIGAGVGGAFNEAQKSEWQAAGVVASQRARRFEEIVQIVRRLGAGEAVSFSGRHFDLDQVSIGPFPVRPEGVPILLASHWRAQQEAQMTRAAKLGSGLISISDTPDEYAWLTERVRGLNAEFGRDPAHFETVFYMTVNIDNDSNKAETEANEYLTRYYGANIWGTRWGPFGEAQRVKERMAEYVAAGAQTLVVRFASFRPEQQLERFLEQVAPAFA